MQPKSQKFLVINDSEREAPKINTINAEPESKIQTAHQSSFDKQAHLTVQLEVLANQSREENITSETLIRQLEISLG